MKALAILDSVKQINGRLEPVGDRLRMLLPPNCPSELKEEIRAHKPEIMAYLKARAVGLSPDKARWLHVTDQILAGEFDGCDRSTAESLAIGLRGFGYVEVCRQALERLPHEFTRRFYQP